MKKIRNPIPEDIAVDVLFTSDRACCVCTLPGKPVQIHHIDENPSNNSLNNLAVLCLDCHNDTMIKGGFGRKLSKAQIVKYKDEWLLRVVKRKATADELASIKAVTNDGSVREHIEYRSQEDLPLLIKYLNNITVIHNAQLIISETKWNGGTTYDMKQGCYDIIDFYTEILKELATFYPPNHFIPSISDFFFQMTASRYSWHRLVCEPFGAGTGGTIVGVNVANSVMYDLRNMVSGIATELIFQFDLENSVPNWMEKWSRRD